MFNVGSELVKDGVSNRAAKLTREPAQVGTDNGNRDDEKQSDETFGEGVAGQTKRQWQVLRGTVFGLMRRR